MIAAMMVAVLSANAQEAGQMAIGVDGNMAFKSGNTRFAAGAKFQYSITDNFRLEAGFKYYPKKDYNTVWNAGLNLQYVIPVLDGFNVYPILNAGVLGQSIDESDFGHGSESTTAFVYGGGGGAEYFVGQNVKLYLDFIYQYGKKDGYAVADNPLLTVGIAYAF